LASALRWNSPLIDPFWQGASGSIEEAVLRAQIDPDAVLIRLPIPPKVRKRYQPLATGVWDLNMRLAKLSLQGERRHSQDEDCSQALHPSPGTYPPSLIGARFWTGTVRNSHSTWASNRVGFASLNKRDKRANSTYAEL